MDANSAYGILVIILSVTLAIFLILAIVAVSLGISLLRKANHVAESAESVASDIESFSSSLKNAAGPAALLRIIMGAVSGARRK